MFIQRSAVAIARRAAPAAPRVLARRTFASSLVRREEKKEFGQSSAAAVGIAQQYKKLDEIKTEEDLLPPGAKPGTVPTDLEQSTGLERLEILGKTQGIDVFDMKPLDSSRVGTLDDPIVVNSAGEEQYVGCTGCPADSHHVLWLTLSRDQPKSRCMECGSVYEMHYIGPQDDPHAHDHGHGHDHHGPPPRPKNMADFIKPEYAEL